MHPTYKTLVGLPPLALMMTVMNETAIKLIYLDLSYGAESRKFITSHNILGGKIIANCQSNNDYTIKENFIQVQTPFLLFFFGDIY